jgi:hypothetical protein
VVGRDVVFSVIRMFTRDPETALRVSLARGWLFILVSTTLLDDPDRHQVRFSA